jgi:hypothetical protein
MSSPSQEISFGVGLYQGLRARYGNNVPAVIVLAHEWGHQVQFQNNLLANAPPTRTAELEADFFAGFYVGWAERLNNSGFATALDVLHSVGTEDYTDPTFHGTAPERKYLGLVSWAAAQTYAQLHKTPSWGELSQVARMELASNHSLTAESFTEAHLVQRAAPLTTEVEAAR